MFTTDIQWWCGQSFGHRGWHVSRTKYLFGLRVFLSWDDADKYFQCFTAYETNGAEGRRGECGAGEASALLRICSEHPRLLARPFTEPTYVVSWPLVPFASIYWTSYFLVNNCIR